uniref:Uncharacterized protein n=1 Tax=Glossina austeni TaxID=7395 RepID=A0A1A9UJG1_GLOAU
MFAMQACEHLFEFEDSPARETRSLFHGHNQHMKSDNFDTSRYRSDNRNHIYRSIYPPGGYLKYYVNYSTKYKNYENDLRVDDFFQKSFLLHTKAYCPPPDTKVLPLLAFFIKKIIQTFWFLCAICAYTGMLR